MNFNELDLSPEFQAAFEALENSRDPIFITGKAGTGKSTLLQYFRHRSAKSCAFLAPTGVSAINVQGQTIHSFFQFKPDTTPETAGLIPVRKKKRALYRQLEAVVIDEISMVRADLMDCIDAFLRIHGPRPGLRFGGVRMIFFGDLHQLPPVVKSNEAEIFKTVYKSPYFFDAKALQEYPLRILELTTIYRQKDEKFISLLNAVRDDALTQEHLAAFNTRFSRHFIWPEDELFVVLTTTNDLALRTNAFKLQGLSTKEEVFDGDLSGDFDRRMCPADERLSLKPGAQVMLLTNDPEKRWVNGTLGVVLRLDAGITSDAVIVRLQNGREVDVKRNTWELFHFTYDEVEARLCAKSVGYFTQYPLKLAWAVTIHKAQGQTFEKVVIDFGFGTFAHGQAYVALSRCTTLEGLVLRQPLTRRHVLMDQRIKEFYNHVDLAATVAG